MAASLDQFSKAVVAAGLMTGDELKALWSAIPAPQRPKDAAGLAKLLVEQKKLTPFQALVLTEGRPTPLTLGDYSVLDEIGAGGMGQVYKARHRRMERIVALKVMSAAAMKDEASVKRFQREVRAAARLEHPNIVTAYDSGEAGSVKYLVMQFVDGGDLSSLVKKNGPLEIEKAVNYVLQSARGLSFAHGEGVIHRDIKPANLLLDKKGVVKILDMGLARIESSDDGLTATEQVMGTVDYMSPEQAANTKGVDGRADIYSLGCTLWFLLTGKKTYEADTMIARLMAHKDAPLPSLVKVRDHAPWPLEQAFHKMIAKRAEDRFQSMDEVIAALEPFAGSGIAPVGMGSSIGQSGSQNAELSAFLKGGGPGTKQTKPTPSKTNVEADATAQFVKEVETDPKSAISVPPLGARPAAKPQANRAGGKSPPNKNLIYAGAGVAALLVLLGVWFALSGKPTDDVAAITNEPRPLGSGGAANPSTPLPDGRGSSTATFFPPGGSSPGATPSFVTAASSAMTPDAAGFVYLDAVLHKSYVGYADSLHKLATDPDPAAFIAKFFPGEVPAPKHAILVHCENDGNAARKGTIPLVATLTYDLTLSCDRFQARVRGGTDGRKDPLFAEVWGDGKKLWESSDLISAQAAGVAVDVDVRGVRELQLIARAVKRAQGSHVFWSEPRLTVISSPAPVNSTVAKTTAAALRWTLAPSKPEDIRWLRDEWKAIVTVRVAPGQDVRRKPTDPLPTGPMTIVGIETHRDGGSQMTDAALARIATLTDLEILRCDFGPPGAAATKAGMAEIAKLTELRYLHLGRLGTADTDYSFLQRLPHLERLGFAVVPILDWVDHVQRLNPLRELLLHDMDLTRITELKTCRGLESLILSGHVEKSRQAAQELAPLTPWIRFDLRTSGSNVSEIIGPTAPPPPEAGAAVPPAATGEVDLLPLVDLAHDALVGEWSKQGAEFHTAPVGNKMYRLRLPVDPGEAYSLKLAFRSDRGYPVVTLPLEGVGVPLNFLADEVMLHLGGPKSKKDDRQANVFAQGYGHFGDNSLFEIVIDVTRPTTEQVRIAVNVNGKATLDWTGTREQIKAIPSAAQTEPAFDFGAFSVKDAPTRLLEAKLTTTQGAMKLLRAQPAGATPTPPGDSPGAKTSDALRWPLAPTKLEDIQWLLAKDCGITLRGAGAFGGDPLEVHLRKGDSIPTGPQTVVGLDWRTREQDFTTDDDLARIATLIDLERLILGDANVSQQITSAGVLKLAALVNMQRLTLLQCGDKARGAEVILQAMPNLVALSLPSGGPPTLEWAVAAAKRPSITKIVGSMGESSLAALETMSQLRELELNSNPHLTEAAVQKFVAARPECLVTARLNGQTRVFEPTAPPSSEPRTSVSGPAAPRWPFDPSDGREYVWSAPENLGPNVNTGDGEQVWAISPDELTLIFVRGKAPQITRRSALNLPFPPPQPYGGLPEGSHGTVAAGGSAVAFVQPVDGKDQVFLAHRNRLDLPFPAPQLAPPPVNDGTQIDRPVLSPDGLTLLALSLREKVNSANLWMFTRPALDQPFNTAEKVPGEVNTPDWDMPFHISNDRLFVIAATQRGGQGGIGGERFVSYFTRAAATDPFGPGVELEIPMGDALHSTNNSGFRLSGDGRALYFESTKLPGVSKRFDIWVTRRVPK